MKKIKLILFLVLISQFCFSQTKEETVEWLNSKLANYAPFDGKFEIEIVYYPEYGETLLITKHFRFGASSADMHYSFKPDAITSLNLTAHNNTNGQLSIEIISSTKRIFYEKKEFIGDIVLMFDGPKEEITKINKGILHLLSLMGNTISPKKEYFND